MTFKNKKLRKGLKYFIILAVLDLLYLNVFVPVKLSVGQIFLIVLEVIKVCDRKEIDVSTLTSDQLDNRVNHKFSKTSFQGKRVSLHSEYYI